MCTQQKAGMYVVMIVLMILGLSMKAKGQEGMEEGLLFYASFDTTLEANIAGGNPKSVSQKGNLTLDQGVKGKALVTGDGFVTALTYENEKNFEISQGTISLWIKPIDWSGKNGKAKLFNIFMNGEGSAKGYLGLEVQRFNQPEPTLLFYSYGFANRKEVNISDPGKRENGLWYQVAFTWDDKEAKLYIKGNFVGGGQITTPFSASDLSSTIFRLGASSEEHTAIDEFRIWGRPLSPSEISDQVIYKSHLPFSRTPEHKWTLPEDYLTFHLTFDDEKLSAEKSSGIPLPFAVSGKPVFVDGVRGKGILLNADTSLTYTNSENLVVPGAISFWIRLHRDRIKGKDGTPYEFTIFFYMYGKKGGNLGVQDSVYGRLLCFIHNFPGIYSRRDISGPAFPWQKGRWFHILVNFHKDKAELFLDGQLLAQTILERPLQTEEFTPVMFGSRGKPNGFPLDEIMFFSRPLISREVVKLAGGEEQQISGKISYFPSLPALVIEADADNKETFLQAPMQLVLSDLFEQKSFLDITIKPDE